MELLGSFILKITPDRRRKRVKRAAVNSMQRPLLFRRFCRSLLLLCLVTAASCGLIWGGSVVLNHLALFRLSDIQVTGNVLTSTQQIVESGRLELGQSLLRTDSASVERDICSLPWIERVQVEKHWPSMLVIKVLEHRPLALVNLETIDGAVLMYVNSKGELFAKHAPGQDMDFPVISGLQALDGERPVYFQKGHLGYAALRLLELAAKGNAMLPIQSISEVHLDAEEGMVVYLLDRPFPVYFGSDEVFTKYYRLVKILDRLYRKDLIDEVEFIRIDYMKNQILVANRE